MPETELTNIDNYITFWIESSDKDYKTMSDLYNTKNYHWSLFMGHLVIEKLLKAIYLKEKQQHPLLIHDLRRLAEKSGLSLNDEKINLLDSISRFNINARYDDYKQSFYKLCTPDFTKEWIDNINKLRQWIKELL